MTAKERMVVAAGTLSILASLAFSAIHGVDFGEAWIRNSARIAVVWYALAVLGMIYLRPKNWLAADEAGRLVRWTWTWGAIIYLIHVAVAFHYFHRWSHANAYAHVAEASRFGEGIFVSYLFTALWALDAAAWWVSPHRYAARSGWIGKAIHLFMLFIVVNGTIIFEKGVVRWIGGIMLICFAVAFLHRGLTRRPSIAR